MDIHSEIMELLIYGIIYILTGFVIGFAWGFFIARDKNKCY